MRLLLLVVVIAIVLAGDFVVCDDTTTEPIEYFKAPIEAYLVENENLYQKASIVNDQILHVQPFPIGPMKLIDDDEDIMITKPKPPF